MATLINRGTDTAGNRLIYDTELDITWYDYNTAADNWANQVAWADSLSVTLMVILIVIGAYQQRWIDQTFLAMMAPRRVAITSQIVRWVTPIIQNEAIKDIML